MVFSTETLAAGINMPARTTVISALSRRNDSGHVRLTHNQLLQMAGRAGRRGYDTAGALAYQCIGAGTLHHAVNTAWRPPVGTPGCKFRRLSVPSESSSIMMA